MGNSFIENLKNEFILGASFASTDFHHFQKDYNKIKDFNLKSWHDIAWKGDELNSKIILWSKSLPINNIKFFSSNFINENGKLISSNNIKFFWLKETLANIGRNNPSAPVEPFPDIIHKSGVSKIEKIR